MTLFFNRLTAFLFLYNQTMTSDHLTRQAQKIHEHRSRTEPFTKELSGMSLVVMPGVFPGGTDTALLCDSLKVQPGERVLDLCTGTGAVAIKAALAGAAAVVGTDLSPAAVQNAAANKAKFGLANLTFLEADLFPPPGPLFDVITINPPYTDTEAPDITAAMFWDKDNRVVKTFFAKMSKFLKPGGRAYLSWPSFAPAQLIEDLAHAHNYSNEIIARRASQKSGFEYRIYRLQPKNQTSRAASGMITPMKKWQTTSSKFLVHDRWLKLRADSCITPAGDVIEPYYVFEYSDWITCMAIDAKHNAITLNHYRHGINDFVPGEMIGGMIESTDGSPAECAKRELAEEIGYVGGKIYYTGTSYPNPATHTNKNYSFLAVGGDCSASPDIQLGETFEVKKIPLSTFAESLEQPKPGIIYQSLHLTCIFMALNFIKHSSDPSLQDLKHQLPR